MRARVVGTKLTKNMNTTYFQAMSTNNDKDAQQVHLAGSKKNTRAGCALVDLAISLDIARAKPSYHKA